MKKTFNLILTVTAVFFLVMFSENRVNATGAVLTENTPVWFDAEYYAAAYPDVYETYGKNAAMYGGFDSAMWFHYRNQGVYEGRIPAASPLWFDPVYYASAYPDVVSVYGNDPATLFTHYITLGRAERRRPNAYYIHTPIVNSILPGTVTPAVTAAVPQTVTVPAPAAPAVTAPVPQTGVYVPTGVPAGKSPYYIIVDRTFNVCNVFTVGPDGTYSQLIRSMLCSTGREGHGTPGGTFTIYEHTSGGGWINMIDGTWAVWGMRFRTGGYMFHSVCFSRRGDALPIPEEAAALGSKASLGCVRLSVDDAKWLYNTVPNGTMVTIGN